MINEGRLPSLEILSVFILNISGNTNFNKQPFQVGSLANLKKLVLRNDMPEVEQQLLNAAINLQVLHCCGTKLNLEGMKKLRSLKVEAASLVEDLLPMLEAVKPSLTKLELWELGIPSEQFPTFPNVKELCLSYCRYDGEKDISDCFPNLEKLKIKYMTNFYKGEQTQDYIPNLIVQLNQRGENGLKSLVLDFEQSPSGEFIRQIARSLNTRLSFPVKVIIRDYRLVGKGPSSLLGFIVNLKTGHLIIDKLNPWNKLSELWEILASLKCQKEKEGIVEFREVEFPGQSLEVLTSKIKQDFIGAMKTLSKGWEFVRFKNCRVFGQK